MELKDAYGAYLRNSTSASAVARQASFAGIALVWIFRSQYGEGIVLPNGLLWPLYFLVISLSFDLLQYISASLVWGMFHRYKEVKLKKEYMGDIGSPAILNAPANIFFWCKMGSVIFGYFTLALYVLDKLKIV